MARRIRSLVAGTAAAALASTAACVGVLGIEPVTLEAADAGAGDGTRADVAAQEAATDERAPDAPVPGLPYAAEVLADQPRAYWRLAETSGPVAKDERGAFDGAYSGTVTFAAPGPLAGGTSRAIRVDGDGQMNANGLAQLPSWNELAMELWVSPSSVDVETSIVGFFATDGTNGPRLLRDEPTDLFQFHSGTGEGAAAGAFSTTTPAIDAWYHVVVAIDAANVARIWVNGTLEGSATITDRPPGSGFFAVGADYDTLGDGGVGVNDRWRGRLAEVAVYDHVLSSERIAAHYAARDRAPP